MLLLSVATNYTLGVVPRMASEHWIICHCYCNDEVLHRLGHNDYIDNGTSSPLMVDTFNLLRLVFCCIVAIAVLLLKVFKC